MQFTRDYPHSPLRTQRWQHAGLQIPGIGEPSPPIPHKVGVTPRDTVLNSCTISFIEVFLYNKTRKKLVQYYKESKLNSVYTSMRSTF